MSRVFFDSARHPLEPFAFTFARDAATIRLEADKPRQCRMRYAIGGEPEMGDPRRFRMYPEDAALCVGNAKKRLSQQPKGGIPQLFEHGWGMYGGKAGGYWLDLYEEAGDLWALVALDERTWEEAVDPGMNWFGRSMGVSCWVDPDGFIRPADIFEGSFTNFPAMKGLGVIEPMAQLEQRLSPRSAVLLGGLWAPQRGLVDADGKPIPSHLSTSEGEAASGGPLGHPANFSPETASNGKEQEMNLSAATLKLLGFAEGEKPTPEQIETAFNKSLESRASSRASSEPGDEKPLSKGDVLGLLSQFREEDRTKLRGDLEAELAKRERARSIEAVILEAENDGFATAAEREDLRKDGELLGPERLKAQLSKRAPSAPTRRVFVPGDEATTFSTGTPAAGIPADISTLCTQASATFRRPRIEQYARQRGISVEAAAAELGVN